MNTGASKFDAPVFIDIEYEYYSSIEKLSSEHNNKWWVCVLISLNPVLTTTVNSSLVE